MLDASRSAPGAPSVARRITLVDLLPGTTYRLRIIARAPTGEAAESRSDELTFRTGGSRDPEIERLMPHRDTAGSSLADLSLEYLGRLRNLSRDQRARLQRELAGQTDAREAAPTEQEKKELLSPSPGRAGPELFERRVDVLRRWLIKLRREGKPVKAYEQAPVRLITRLFVSQSRAVEELDRTVREVATLEGR